MSRIVPKATGAGYKIVDESAEPLDRELVKLIAADIGKAVAHHIETMYPRAVMGAGPNMLVSVKGCVYNEIMAALDTMDPDAIKARLAERKRHRSKIKAIYRRIRSKLAQRAEKRP